ncbi:SHOCT domain-containing protein [Terrisporobacter petrolearius]|uniref:SHOCT domain-containing protein n=1 Tax=Terrisporobacter petrolearius TaxID=1460447 RepID=UPI003EB92B4C
MNENERPAMVNKNFTKEELQQEFNYILSQQMLKKMLDKGMISADEFNKITEKNRQIFSPHLSRIMP